MGLMNKLNNNKFSTKQNKDISEIITVQWMLSEFLQDSLDSHLQNLQKATPLTRQGHAFARAHLNSYKGPGNHPEYNFH